MILRRERESQPRMPFGYTREQWRDYARECSVPRGRNTMNTIRNLIQSKKLSIVETAIKTNETV